MLLLGGLSTLFSFASTDSFAGDGFAGVAGTGERGGPGDTPVRTVLRTTARCFSGFAGLATGLGACTVMLGREVLPEGLVSAIAVPLGPHNNAIDRIAMADGATRGDDILMRRSPKSGH